MLKIDQQIANETLQALGAFAATLTAAQSSVMLALLNSLGRAFEQDQPASAAKEQGGAS